MRRLVPASSRAVVAVWMLGALLLGLAGCAHTQVRSQAAEEEEAKDKDLDIRTIGELTCVDNVQPIAVGGVGLVTGLDGTGGSPLGFSRTMLEEQLRKQRPLLEELLRRQHVKTVGALLDSPDNAVVVISATIPAGARKSEKIDIEVTLPNQSKVTSLRGGYLHDCVLYSYNTTRNIGQAVNPEYAKPDALLKGHILARAQGPLVVGLGDGDEAARVRRGHVWEGGVSLVDRPFFLALNNDRKFKAALANTVAERINSMFQDDARKRSFQRLMELDDMTTQINTKFPAPMPGKGEMAQATSKEGVAIKVPYEYRFNAERYLLVVRLIPLREAPEVKGRYRRKLEQMLLDPGKTVRAALRLEALGKDSIPALKNALTSEHILVRFCAAESLAYLGSPSCGEELSRLAQEHVQLRSACLKALASLDEAVCHLKLTELMALPVPDLRYGAFVGLRLLHDRDIMAQGELLGDAFWLYQVMPQSPAMVHVASARRPEIVLFGQEPNLVPPVKILAGPEFTVTAEPGDDRCLVSRFVMQSGKIYRHACSCKLEEVIHTMADMGAQYPDVVDLLQKAEGWKCLTCAVKVDALPPPLALETLARGGRDPNFLNETPAPQGKQDERGTGGGE